MLKNIRLGVKMIGGFLIVALIVLIVGVISWVGAADLEQSIVEIGQVRLPSIEALLNTEIAMEELMLAQRSLLSELLTQEQRQAQLANFQNSRAEIHRQWEYFLTLPATAEEERLSQILQTEINEWGALNDQWLTRNRDFEALGILDPANLVANMLQFRGDHYQVELQVALLLQTGQNFSGGDDATACNFGRWLQGFHTNNRDLERLLTAVTVPHNAFHRATGDIRDAVDQGNTERAQSLFIDTMFPASEQVFDILYEIIALADEADAVRDGITEMVFGPIYDQARDAMDLLDELIHINENIAEELVNNSVAAAATVIFIIIAGMIIGFLIAIALGILLTRAITVPVGKGVEFSKRMATGDLSGVLDIRQKDEIGVLADAMREMQNQIKYNAGVLEKIADGDITMDVKVASDKDTMGTALTDMVESLNDILSQVNTAVEQVAAGSDQVSQASQNLSQGATEQASSLEEISASANEVNSQSTQNAENATEANALAKKAAEDASTGNRQMEELVQAMNQINASSDEINKVVKVIDDIAFQINLLALNANVEAARAGKYGKGFAVVAEEVRNLAVRASQAVKETSQMVESSITNIKKGNEFVGITAEQLGSIVGGVTKVENFLAEIATASREQANAIDQITSGLEQIDQVTQSNTASAEESASASEELAAQGQQLKSLVARFRLKTTMAQSPRYLPDYTKSAQQSKAHSQPPKPMKKDTETTGVTKLDPSSVIKLDDDDFDRY